MKRGSGIKGLDDRSSGIEMLIAEALAKINPTDPLILAKQAARRNLNCSDSSGISFEFARPLGPRLHGGRAEASSFFFSKGPQSCLGLRESGRLMWN
jgi:hypothetical protein